MALRPYLFSIRLRPAASAASNSSLNFIISSEIAHQLLYNNNNNNNNNNNANLQSNIGFQTVVTHSYDSVVEIEVI